MARDLETRMAKMEAAEDIRKLKARYALACDDNYDADRIAACFTEDAVWDGGERFGRHEGRDAIHKFFSEVSKQITWALHYMVGPDIEVADDLQSATGAWYLYEPCTMGGRALWIGGKYADTYRREADGWKFSDVKVDIQMVSPFEEGWEKRRFA
jgi:ketosteroid isomerase-like protein